MSDETCTCPVGRPLGMGHLPSCPQEDTGGTVHVLRNPITQRAVAVPDEIVSEAERDYKAYQLHRRGKSWTEIAQDGLYESADAAAASVKRYLDEGRAIIQELTRTEIIATEVDVLRAYRDSLWDAATGGSTKAVMASLAIHDRWVRLFGLDQAEAGDAAVQTVVVPSEEFIAELRLASEAADGETPEASAG